MADKILTEGSADRKLRQHITPLSAWALSIGTSIGWGSFVITSNTYLSGAGPMGSAVGMLLGALVMLVIARNYHRLWRDLRRRPPHRAAGE